jgi:hypothetical protein
MGNSFLIVLAAWFFPGAGHFIQKRYGRGAVIAAAIWIMFIIGIASGGAYYPGFSFSDGALLYLLNFFAKLGNGLGFIVSGIASASADPQVAARATFEYGGRFLETAGLLNYLAAMDAADISLGRKR